MSGVGDDALNNSAVLRNGIGLDAATGGSIQSFRNNAIAGNTNGESPSEIQLK